MMHRVPIILVFICAWASPAMTGCAAGKQLMVVGVSVADLRSKPYTSAQAGAHDPKEETQLIYGERVRVLKMKSGWARVQAVEQPEYTHRSAWEGYPGWVEASSLLPFRDGEEPNAVVTAKWASLWLDSFRTKPLGFKLPMGTFLHARDMGNALWQVRLAEGTVAWMDHADAVLRKTVLGLSAWQKRKALIQNAAQLIGDPYFWGGRSPHDSAAKGTTGVDCSGLVSLSFRTIGQIIPRDAHEQHLRAHAVKQLQPGDLIFLSERSNPKRIVHVMLYAGDGQLIEGPGTGQFVRRISVKERLGSPLEQLRPGGMADGQTVSFGSYLND